MCNYYLTEVKAKFDSTSGLKFKINGLNTITNDNSDYNDLDLNDDFYQKRYSRATFGQLSTKPNSTLSLDSTIYDLPQQHINDLLS
ncbi:3936_t:CDS:2, partial [Diversispora eburnea]